MSERVQTLVQLTDALVAELDERAREQGISRSELIGTLLDAGLHQVRDDAVSTAVVVGYRRDPQADGLDAWGDLTAWSEVNRRRNLAALTAEEGEQRW